MPPKPERMFLSRILESPDKIPLMKQFLDEGLSKTDISILGESFVERAVSARNIAMVRFLIEYGVPVDLASQSGSNALYKAYKIGDQEMINLIKSATTKPEDYFVHDSKIVTLGSIADSWSLQGAGILPFTIIDGTIYLCLGRSIHDNQLTWFSGTRDRTTDVDWIATAQREFAEETYNIFGTIQLDKKMYCIHNFREVMVIVPFKSPDIIDKTISEFRKHVLAQEIIDLVWISTTELDRLINNEDPSIYRIVRDTLLTISMKSFTALLKKIFV